jgi:hypothetical protein
MRRRWLRRLLVAATTLVVVLAVTYVFVLPRLVHTVVTGLLDRSGLPGTHFDVKRVTPWRATITGLATPAGDLRIAEVDVRYRPGGAMSGNVDRITVSGAEVRATFRNGKLTTPLSAAAGTGNSVNIPFRTLELASSTLSVDWDGQTLRLPTSGVIKSPTPRTASVHATVRVEAPTGELLLPGGTKLRAPSGVLSLTASLDGTLRYDDGDGLTWSASVDVTNPQPVTLAASGVDADLGRVRIAGRGSGGTGAATVTTSLNAELTIEGAALKHAASGVSLAGISVRMPVTMNADKHVGTDEGAFTVASVAIGREQLKPLAGTLAVRDRRATFSATWAALPDSVLSASGWIERRDSGVSGDLTASLPPGRLDDAGMLARRVPALKGWDMTGSVGLDADVKIAESQPRGRITLALDGVEATSKDAGAEVHGLSGRVAVDFDHATNVVSTAGSQRIRVSRAAFGTIELTDAVLAFRLDDQPEPLLVEQFSAGWLGGRVSTADVRFDPRNPKFTATLAADNVGLKEFLAFAAEGRARGEGRLSGRVTMRFDGPGKVAFGPGFLRSQSPTGEVQVLDTKWLGEMIDRSDPRFSTDSQLKQVRQRILEALSDFSYDRLTFNFTEEPESRGLLQASTHGKGRVGEHPQELDFTLNVRGVNDLVKYGLQGKRRYDQLTNPGK